MLVLVPAPPCSASTTTCVREQTRRHLPAGLLDGVGLGGSSAQAPSAGWSARRRASPCRRLVPVPGAPAGPTAGSSPAPGRCGCRTAPRPGSPARPAESCSTRVAFVALAVAARAVRVATGSTVDIALALAHPLEQALAPAAGRLRRRRCNSFSMRRLARPRASRCSRKPCQVLRQGHERVRRAAALDLARHGELHEVLAGASAAVAGGAEARAPRPSSISSPTTSFERAVVADAGTVPVEVLLFRPRRCSRRSRYECRRRSARPRTRAVSRRRSGGFAGGQDQAGVGHRQAQDRDQAS